MARIRSIKPEFWTDEKVVELSAFARLLFIGIWNFCDDDGRMTYSHKRLKMQIFPSDDVDCAALTREIEQQGMVHIYEVDGVEYLQVSQFFKHQKIDKRTASKLPIPPTNGESPRISPSHPDGREGKGMEGNGDKPFVASVADDQSQSVGNAKPAKPDCPHQDIIAIYHEVLPQCPQIRDWTPARATHLRARWNEDPKRQNLEYWRRFFGYVAGCDFLVGKSKQPFFADLEWIVTSKNFVKIREEKYANRDSK